MKVRLIARITMICIVAVCSLPLLVACDGKDGKTSSSSGPATPDKVAADTVWQARVSKDADEFRYYIEEATAAAEMARGFAPGTDIRTNIQKNTASGFYGDMFSDGNDSYRAGDYLNAEDCYNTVLTDLPTHFGANNNLTLALLQQQMNEGALIQALKTAILYPNELGCLLNVQVAGDACGFDPYITERELNTAFSEFGYTSVYDLLAFEPLSSGSSTGNVNQSYNYNLVCSLVDFEMDPSSDINTNYTNILDRIVDLSLYQSGDPDAEALLAYLKGVGKLNGLDVSNLGS